MEITITIPDALVSEARLSGLSPETYIERLLDRIASSSERAQEHSAKGREERAPDSVLQVNCRAIERR